MKHIFILNSFTLKDDVEKIKQKIKDYCIRENIDYIIEVNSPKLNTEDIVEKYRQTKNIIIAVGGDGTINRIINVISGTKNILGIIPLGSGNDFHKSIKKYLKTEYNNCDLVKINNKYFINTACFGIDADVAHNKGKIKSKWIPKSQRYTAALIKTFFEYKCKELTIEINGKKINGEYATVAVCNGMYYGGGYKISPTSDPTNGLLDVYIVDKINKFRMINLILKMRDGKHTQEKEVQHYETTKLTIKSPKKIVANIDGEELESTQFDIEIIKNGIEIYYDKKLIDYITK